MEKWLEQRETYLQGIARKKTCVKYGKSIDDDRVFPITVTAIRTRWNKLLDKAKLNKRDKRTSTRELHLHTLRKYFSTRMGDSCNRDILELLLGHNGYLSNSYLRVTKQELGDAYKGAMSKVTIYESRDKSNLELEKEIKRRDEK